MKNLLVDLWKFQAEEIRRLSFVLGFADSVEDGFLRNLLRPDRTSEHFDHLLHGLDAEIAPAPGSDRTREKTRDRALLGRHVDMNAENQNPVFRLIIHFFMNEIAGKRYLVFVFFRFLEFITKKFLNGLLPS